MAVVAAIVMAAKPVSNPVVCCLLSGDAGCDGTDRGTCKQDNITIKTKFKQTLNQ